MIRFTYRGRRTERGQTAIMAALSLVVLVSLVGLVIDGGFAWGKQRQTQNGSDAVAKAGAVVLQHDLSDIPQTDLDVACAVEEAARLNDVELVMAEYTDHEGTVMGPVGDCLTSTAAIPDGAQGVRATTEQEFDTFIAGVVGMPTFTAAADATAVVGPFQAVCPASAGCGALPVTFPQTSEICDDTSAEYSFRNDDDDGIWEPYEVLPPDTALTAANLAIIPLCPDNPGSVGWLDFGCGNLAEHIENPCSVAIPIPSWEQTHTGNINCCEGELEEYTGEFVGTAEDADLVVPIPIHINTCSADRPNPSDTCEPTDLDWSGNGNNNFFRVKFWIGFKFDEANVSGSDTSCQNAPGQPEVVNPGGGLGCLKGWIVARYDAPGSIGIGLIDPTFEGDIGVTLIE